MAQCPRCNSALSNADFHCPACDLSIGEESADTAVLPADPPSNAPTKLEYPSNRSNTPPTSGGVARFISGTVLAGRYRIVGLIGKGGMGEVYQADDLELEQTVALKFLPEKLDKNEELLRRFRGEVRNARQVSHRNVCRVFDIGETEGLYYITMEYIDGDDLSMLLNRIGRLPSDKAVEISRDICMGLAAIHKAGILHRDLKPANIIIDSKGEARITDFGIAGLEAEIRGAEPCVGTPAYMSPEQADGKVIDQRSDIYSLGLLLYEIFTGKQAFEGESVQELRIRHATTTPTNPSEIVTGIDPMVDKVINRCLEKDPKDRPDSAFRVAMSLPGGDPLQVALEAGETPTPKMVASAPNKGVLRPGIALALSLAIVSGFTLSAILHQYYQAYNIVPLEKSPEILAERARTIAVDLGYEALGDSKYRFGITGNYLAYARQQGRSEEASERLKAGQPVYIYFVYRQSPHPLVPWDQTWVRDNDPPMTGAGMVNVFLDTKGRLILFTAVPDKVIEERAQGAQATDWAKLFVSAGLDAAKFEQVEPQWISPVYADEKIAWAGTLPDFSDMPIRIEAAAYQGKPVFFDIVNPWEEPARPEQQSVNLTSLYSRARNIALYAILTLVLAGAALLALHNMRVGRSDLAGGARLTGFCFVSNVIWRLLASDTVPSIAGQMGIFEKILAHSLYLAALIGLVYIALEPYARRYWPQLLISWNRLLTGDIRDPMIGRDILIGGLAGIVVTSVAVHFSNFVGSGDGISVLIFGNPLTGWSGALSQLFGFPVFPVLRGLGSLFLLVLFFIVFRNRKVSIVSLFLLSIAWTALPVVSEGWIFLLGVFFANVIIVFVLVRFGLLAGIMTVGFQALSHRFPVTLDTGSHLFPGTVIVFFVVISVAIFGFYTSKADARLFEQKILE